MKMTLLNSLKEKSISQQQKVVGEAFALWAIH